MYLSLIDTLSSGTQYMSMLVDGNKFKKNKKNQSSNYMY